MLPAPATIRGSNLTYDRSRTKRSCVRFLTIPEVLTWSSTASFTVRLCLIPNCQRLSGSRTIRAGAISERLRLRSSSARFARLRPRQQISSHVPHYSRLSCMDLHQKIRTLPTSPGVYLYKNADGDIIYVGKANNLRSRVRSYFLEGAAENAKTGTLLREAVDLDYIVVDNEKEALALENNLIKQKKPRYNILLRDDKTYPYIKLTIGERHPRVYPTRRLRRDGSLYFGPYFPTSLAYRIVDLIHRHFLIPSCKLDLNRYYPRPCLQYYIGRCLRPVVEGLTTPERYAEAVHDVRMFLEGRGVDLSRSLQQRMAAAAERQQYELAAKYRDLISTVELLDKKQRIAAVEGDDADVFGYHYENEMLAVNLFHMRGGKIVDKREFFWEDLGGMPGTAGFEPGEFFSALLKQVYLDQQYVPHTIYVAVDFEDRIPLEEVLSEGQKRRVHIHVPQRGEKRSLIDLVGQNAKQAYDQRFRVMKPAAKAIQEALQRSEEH